MDLYEYWFSHPHVWFDASPSDDAEISKLFADQLYPDQDPDEHMLLLLLAGFSIKDLLSMIILFDQVPRHVFRGEQAAHIVTHYLQTAIEYADIMLSAIDESDLSDDEWIFAVLPYRHQKIHIDRILQEAWRRLDARGSPRIRSFVRATYTRSIPPMFHTDFTSGFTFKRDPTFSKEPYGSVLEDEVVEVSKPRCDLKLLHNLRSLSNVVLSLSGGVDSMVCMHLLQQNEIPFVAVHINYSNRGEANAIEEAFVRKWCEFHAVDLVVRRFDEINRPRCMKHDLREMYETYTKKGRFDAYRIACPNSPINVVMGHHLDDAFENILNNVASGSKIRNLNGMTEVAEIDGLIVHRPLLRYRKSDVFDYAHAHGIPYFKNTTPDWVQRGIIRNTLIPTIERWNPEFVPALVRLSGEVTEAYGALAACTKCVDQDLPRTSSELFWRGVIERHYTQSFSLKALKHFVAKLQHREGPFSVMMNKDTKIRGVVYDTYVRLN